MPELLPAIEINPTRAVKASVICLHGLGADGHDLESLATQLATAEQAVRFIFPHAPQRAITRSDGYVMRAWYDVYGPDLAEKFDEAGIRTSERQVRALIEREIQAGIAARCVVVMGFSQGGAMALHAGLRYPERLGGILALSTYLLLPDKVREEAHPANADVPIMMTHGTQDDVIPLERGEAARAKLQELGYRVQWRVYPMPHTLCVPEIEDMANWLRAILGE